MANASRKYRQLEKFFIKMVGNLSNSQLNWLLFKCDMKNFEETGKPLFKNIEWHKGPDSPYPVFK